MITQPLMMTAPDAASSPTTSGSAAPGAKGATEDFLSLLGQALPDQMAQDLGNAITRDATLKNLPTKGEQAADAQATLAALLGKLDKPEALSALLSHAKTNTTDDKSLPVEAKQEQTHTLSDADLQALSALFAMLPQQAPATVSSGNLVNKDISISSGLKSLPGTHRGQNALSDDAGENPVSLDKGLDPGRLPSAKSTLSVAEQNIDAKTVALSNAETGNRGDTTANNTTSATLPTPTFSSATIATPASTQIAVPVAPHISAQLGSQEWQQAVSQHITLFTRQGQQSAELRLHPEDLGQIQISMKLDDNQAQIQMVSAHSHVRAALEAALPTLRTALAESGIQLGQSNISHESFSQQQQPSGQPQQQAQHSGGRFPSMAQGSEALTVPASVQRLASGNNAVDIFA